MAYKIYSFCKYNKWICVDREFYIFVIKGFTNILLGTLRTFLHERLCRQKVLELFCL